MKRISLFLFLIFALPALSTGVLGQNGPPPEEALHEGQPGDRRPNLLAELGLSPEQVQQIRRMNQERRPRMMEARRRMGEARRSIDMAIYGEAAVSDAEFATRLKEFQAAEADLSRLRFESELAVRRVLTPEQLVRFRDLRRQFAEQRRNNAPARRFERRDGPMRPRQDGPPRRPGI